MKKNLLPYSILFSLILLFALAFHPQLKKQKEAKLAAKEQKENQSNTNRNYRYYLSVFKLF